jgi:multiple sugar transport system ATP-binding protein
VAKVEFEEVGKIYADGTRAVEALSLDVADGEFLVLVGPSGCGKTTALRMAAGLEDISEGVVRIGGRVVNNVPARDRDVAMVFQSYALYPHLDVFDNIAFGLRLRKVPTKEITARVNDAAAALGLTEYLHRRPKALSGGQRQRVAMGRAIVREPSVFLMDEPLSNLDAKLRVQMRAAIARNSRRLGVTTIYVTHDQTEAMTLGHRVAVMKRGVLQQVAAPQELYDRPANLFVAGFIGSPAMNLVKGVYTAAPEPVVVFGDQQRLRVGSEVVAARPRLREYSGQAIAIGIRPEDLSEATDTGTAGTGTAGTGTAGTGTAGTGTAGTGAGGTGAGGTGTAGTEAAGTEAGDTLRVTAELTEALGSDLIVHCGVNIEPVETEDTKELARDVGAEDDAPLGTRFLTTLVGRFSPRARISEGDHITVAVDTNQLHLFDLNTGQSIR